MNNQLALIQVLDTSNSELEVRNQTNSKLMLKVD